MHSQGCPLAIKSRKKNLPLYPTQKLAKNENDLDPSSKTPDTQLPSQACLSVHSIVPSLV